MSSGEVTGPTLAAWKPPLIVAAIATSIVAGFYLGGPGLGMAVGGLAAGSLLVMAARNPPRRPIVPAAAPDRRLRALVVVTEPLEAAGRIGELLELAGHEEAGGPDPELLVLAPARHRFLDRWASDLDRGRHQAQRALVISLATLAAADLEASARVGDEDPVQAVEDALCGFAAGLVVLVGGAPRWDRGDDPVAAELRSRLRVPFAHLRGPSAQCPPPPHPVHPSPGGSHALPRLRRGLPDRRRDSSPSR